jgi:hypothetical protein
LALAADIVADKNMSMQRLMLQILVDNEFFQFLARYTVFDPWRHVVKKTFVWCSVVLAATFSGSVSAQNKTPGEIEASEIFFQHDGQRYICRTIIIYNGAETITCTIDKEYKKPRNPSAG